MRFPPAWTAIALIAGAASAWPFPVDSVLARADSCLNVTWSPDPVNCRADWYRRCWNAGVSICSSDTSLRQSDFIAGRSYKSVAYSYGGNDNHWQFRNRLQRGLLAGSHQCHYEASSVCQSQVLDSIAGTDCSAFVCYAWNEPRGSTSSMLSKYPHIEKSALAPGDALVKVATATCRGAHAVLVAATSGYPQYLIYESTGTPWNGCRSRSINVQAQTEWACYTAIRNPAISGAVSAVSSVVPGSQRPRAPLCARRARNLQDIGRAIGNSESAKIIRIFSAYGREVVESSSNGYGTQLRLAPGAYAVRLTGNSGKARAVRVLVTP